MIHPPKQDESQNHTRAKPDDSGFGRDALGNGTAQLRLGVAYEEGLGVPQDHVTAFMWFNIAASNNQPHAADFRDLLAVKMTAEEISEGQRRSRVCSNSDYHNHQDGHEYFGREKRL